MAGRSLTLTEELEKLEQSITLTLQEIDSNFSRAHQIVTTRILPIVEQYADHSKAVWDGSKFWKQFFEASANVSLSGVEERVEDEDEETSYTQSYDQTNEYAASAHPDGSTTGPGTQGTSQSAFDEDENSLLDNADVTSSTPRASSQRSKPSFADYPIAYESLKQEITGTTGSAHVEADFAPATPSQRFPDMSMTPQTSPATTNTTAAQSTSKRLPATQDKLLHRILDKNYRLQATPLKSTHASDKRTPAKASRHQPSWRDQSTPMSSPPVVAPQLRPEFFDSPVRQQVRRAGQAPRTPGVSVLPVSALQEVDSNILGTATGLGGRSRRTPDTSRSRPRDRDEITWESDSDEDAEGVYREMGMSPPKTIQFSLPESRLLQTPAREASKRIVEDLLATAGAGFGDDTTDEGNSPSIVRVRQDLDESF